MSVPVRLGLRANAGQFGLLVALNALVGGMVGLERSVLPLIGKQDFGLSSTSAILAFVVAFGGAKALTNLAAGELAERLGRKRLLVIGWLVALPVPLLIGLAPSWSFIVAANLLLGINQGLAWSMTVVMKIDLAGPARRGLAMGLNEAAGYGAVSLAALASGYLAAAFSLRPYPFYLGVGCAISGLLLSFLAVKETLSFAQFSATATSSFIHVFMLSSWKHRTLSTVCLTGLVNNLNDGVAWGLFPLLFAERGLGVVEIGVLAALYPAVWGLGQL